MPSIRRTARRRRATCMDDLLPSQRTHLVSSWRSIGPIFRTLDEFTEAWDVVRDEVLERWIAKNPGSRPFAWWRVDHGQERPIVGDGLMFPGNEIQGMRNNNRHWQTFAYLWNFSYLMPQPEYLERRGLISRDEIEASRLRQEASLLK